MTVEMGGAELFRQFTLPKFSIAYLDSTQRCDTLMELISAESE